MNKKKQRIEVVRYWWSKSEESLASAQREFEASSYSFAVNRLYYSVFYAVSSALLERRLTFKKHTGVRATFHKEFIKTGLLDIKWGKLYDQLFEDRQEGDYLAMVSFDREYVETQLNRSIQFLNELRPLISALKSS